MNYNPVMTVSAANYQALSTPDSIVAAFSSGMATTTAFAPSQPLPFKLADVEVSVDGKLARLFYASATQVNYLVPSNIASGRANVVVMNQGRMVSQGTIDVTSVAPRIFTANATGTGVPAGLLLRGKTNGQQVFEPLFRFDAAQKQFVPAPIVRQPGETLFLVLFGSGFNGAADTVQATIGGVSAQVTFAGLAPGYAGLRQFNIRIPDNAPANPATQVLIQARDRLNNLQSANPVVIALQ
jgi:uncharacterized protein (TIGR03437 family)